MRTVVYWVAQVAVALALLILFAILNLPGRL